MIERLRAVIVLPLVAMALAAPAEVAAKKGPKPDPCATARYLIVDGPIVLTTGADIAAVQAGASVALDGACTAVTPTQLRANRKGVTQFRAKWKNCADLGGGNARLDARIIGGCTRLRGTLRAKGLKRPRHFDAVVSRCGDLTLDTGNGEACDDGNNVAGDGCEPDCTMTARPSTTTTTVPTGATTTTLPVGVGVLSLAAVAGPDPVRPNGSVTYQLAVVNPGTLPLTNVKLRLTIPNGVSGSFNCVMDGGVIVPGGTACNPAAIYEWSIGTLNPGVGYGVYPTLFVGSAVTAPLVTSVRVIADNANEATATVTTLVDAVAPLQLAIADGPDPSAAGKDITYTVTFGNRGANSLPTPSLTATVPPGTTLDPASLTDGGTEANGVITWPLGNTLSPGAAGQRTFRVAVTDRGAAESGIRRSTAELHDATLPQPNSARASAVTVIEETPGLQLILETLVDPLQRGTFLNYQLTATNLGTNPLTGVKVRLTIPNGVSGSFNCVMDGGVIVPGGTTCNPGAIYEWDIGTLGGNASVTRSPALDTSDSLPAGSLLVTTARVVNDGGRSARASVTTVVDPLPPLQLAIADGPDPATAGEDITYTVTFGNRGANPLPTPSLTATVPSGTTLDLASLTDGGTEANGVITWPLGNTLSPGAAGQRTFRVAVTDRGAAESGTRRSTAELRDATLPQPNSARASAVTVIEETPGLQLILETLVDPLQRGTFLNYQLTATNLGTNPLTGVKVRLTIPNGVSGSFNCVMDGGVIVPGGTTCNPGAIYEWDIGTLGGNASVTRSPALDTSDSLPAGSLLVTTARVVNDGGRSARASVTTVVDPLPPLQLAIADGPDPATAGEDITYTVTFGNRGANPLPTPSLTATVPSGTTLDLASLTDGGTEANGVITWPLGNTLSPGAAGQRTFRVAVTDRGAAESGTRQTTAELRDATLPQPNSARASAVTVIEETPGLQLILETLVDPLQRGTFLNYQLTATNLGTNPLTGVKVRLTIPNGVSGSFNCVMDGGVIVPGGTTCNPGAIYEWDIGTLGGNASVTRSPALDTSDSLPAGSLLVTTARVVNDGGRSARAVVATTMVP